MSKENKVTKLVSAKEAAQLTDKRVREAEEYRKTLVARREASLRADVIKRIYEATQRSEYSIQLSFIRPETIPDSLREELIANGYTLTEGASYASTTLSGYSLENTVHTMVDTIIVSWEKEDV